MASRADFQKATELFSDWRWRLNNLYYITDKDGRRTQFQMNWAQEALYDEMHYLNIVLKARQLGFTTFIQIFMLDACLFNSNVRAGTIAHTLDDAKIIFRDKVKYPYDNLPDGIRAAVTAEKDTANELVLSNNSSIRVGTSLRSGTLQYLHISEYGKICAKFPEKAREVRTGALNTIEAGQIAFIESTAEGQEGHFYNMCEAAKSRARKDSKLSSLDFKFFFFPWWKNPGYVLDPEGVPIPDAYREYFDTLAETEGIELTPAQKAWYVKKAETQEEDMKREFPATPEEAFEASVEGAYYSKQIAKAELENRIGAHKYIEGLPVHTFWDIGVGDYTSIWFAQFVGAKIGLVGYFQDSGEGAPYYIRKLEEFQRERGWTYGEHWFPHDVKVKEWGANETRIKQLIAAGLRPRVVPDHYVDDGINAVRETFSRCWFDEEAASEGIRALKNYRKEWDEHRLVWRDKPYHNWASHGADSFRYMCIAYRMPREEKPAQPKPIDGMENVTLDHLWKDAERRTGSGMI
jgi:hypothetical protein